MTKNATKAASGKRFTESARIERLGVALCNSMVTAMGHLWREKGVDYGIDGEIELVDDGRVLNHVLWIQSKARGDALRFSGESDQGFRYMCSDVDINYWLSGTAPVLLVCSHPEEGKAWFKHLPSWFADPRRRRDRYVEFDKEADRFDETAKHRLLGLGVDAASGVYLSPAPRQETLTSNLLAVEHLSPQVFSAVTHCKNWSDANPRMVKAGHDLMSDVVFRDGRAYSFRPFDRAPLDVLVDGPLAAMSTDELAESKGEGDRQLLRWLLNATLRELTHRDLRLHPDSGLLYFKAPADGRDKKVWLHRGGKGRSVVHRYDPPEGAGWFGYTRHYALGYQFIYADERWYLALTPTYHFTSDGRADSPFAAGQLSTIKRFEGHEAIRSQTTFWAKYLSERPNLFSGPPDSRLRFGNLATADVDRGIDDKAWKPISADDLAEIEGTAQDHPPRTPTLFDETEAASS